MVGMKEGFWINYRTEREFPIHEHELWVRVPENARDLGIPKRVFQIAINQFTQGKDRNEFIRFLLRNAPVMRVRGHGEYVTFEFDHANDLAPKKAIARFRRKYLGPMTGLKVVNFRRPLTICNTLLKPGSACSASSARRRGQDKRPRVSC